MCVCVCVCVSIGAVSLHTGQSVSRQRRCKGQTFGPGDRACAQEVHGGIEVLRVHCAAGCVTVHNTNCHSFIHLLLETHRVCL